MQYDVTHARLPGLESRGGASRRLPRSLPLVPLFRLSLFLRFSRSEPRSHRLRRTSLARLSLSLSLERHACIEARRERREVSG